MNQGVAVRKEISKQAKKLKIKRKSLATIILMTDVTKFYGLTAAFIIETDECSAIILTELPCDGQQAKRSVLFTATESLK